MNSDIYTSGSRRVFLREADRRHILSLIRGEPISRSQIVRATGLRPARVAAVVDSLLREGLVVERGFGKSAGGRKPLLLKLNNKARYAIGLSVGKSSVTASVLDLGGKIVAKAQSENNSFGGRKGLIQKISTMAKYAIDAIPVGRDKTLGLGITVPGFVDREKGILTFCAYHPWWREIPLKKTIERQFNLPVYIENDTMALTLAERWFGKAKEADDFLYLDVSEGIALGMFLNGELYRGTGGSAGELGHITVDEQGPLCTCGNYGCLEVLASELAIRRKAEELLSQGVYSLITEEAADCSQGVSFESVLRAARREDKVAFGILEDAGHYLGLGMSTVISIFNPSLIVLGGTLIKAGDLILAPMKRTIRSRVLPKLVGEVDIQLSSLAEDSVAFGAAALVLERTFEKP